MGQTADNERTFYPHLPALLVELGEKQEAYEDAEREFQEHLQRLFSRADRVVLLTRASVESERRA